MAPSVLFSPQVIGIFTNKCGGCHEGAPPDGELNLIDGTPDEVFIEATGNETGQDRVDLNTPAASLILTKPSNQVSHLNNPIDGFDPDAGDLNEDIEQPSDYITILRWIQEGAQNN